VKTALKATVSIIVTLCQSAWAASPPDCQHTSAPVTLVSEAGMLESIIFTRDGQLLFTNLGKGTLHVLPAPDGTPALLASGITSPGGIALGEGQDVFVGFGNDVIGTLFPRTLKAGVVRVDLDSGKVSPYAKGLSSANGLVRASDGTLYASNALSSWLGRVRPDGTVEAQWLKLAGNGLAMSGDGKTLYVNQSMLYSRIWKVQTETGAISLHAEAPAGSRMAFFDGLELAADGTLFVAAYLAGEVWRVNQQGDICLVARGLKQPSAVAVGRAGRGFKPSSLYVTTHSGSLLELPGVLGYAAP
jgi:sugar lactone lactonase YvrE